MAEVRVTLRAEPGPAARAAGRSAGGCAALGGGRARHRQYRPGQATSSPARAWIIASLANARAIPWRSASPSASPTPRGRARSASWRSRSRAASMPAATIMSAISASWASTRTARNSTRSRSAAAPTRTPPWAPSSAPPSRATRSSDAVDTIVDVYLRERRDEGERFPDTYRRVGAAALQGGALCRSLRDGRFVADPWRYLDR